VQSKAKISGVAGTDARNALANAVYRDILLIQNAANLQWPASNPANAEMRATFKLDSFPPRTSAPAQQAPEPATQPAPAPVAPVPSPSDTLALVPAS
jgi:hypothetical protein